MAYMRISILMRDKDYDMLAEAYGEVQKHTLEEAGMLSQLAAKGKAGIDAFKQGVKNVAHVASGKGGGQQTANGQFKGSIPGWKGTYDKAKQEHIAKSLAQDIINDIKGTGLVPDGYALDETHVKYWEDAITTYINFINKKSPKETNTYYGVDKSAPKTAAV